MRVLSPDPQEAAFGAPGEPGDPEAIEHLAQRFVSSYEYLLDWSTEVRSMHVSEQMQRLRDITSRMSDLAIQQIRDFVDKIVVETERVAAHVDAEGHEPLMLTLVLQLDIDPIVMKEHSQRSPQRCHARPRSSRRRRHRCRWR